MKFASLNDLYLQQLKDLHSAESQLIKALPKMAKAARNPDLKNAFIEHLEQTKGHLERLKQVAEKLGKRLAGHTCAAMKGLIEEGTEWIGGDAAAEGMDGGSSRRPSVSNTMRWLGMARCRLLQNCWERKKQPNFLL